MRVNVLDYNKDCNCGRKHSILVKDILIEEHALEQLPTLIENYGYNDYDITVICDSNTYEVAGKQVIKLLPNCKVINLPAINEDGIMLHADNHGVKLVQNEMTESKLLIAVGSGTIHDITRYIASSYHINFISVPTAASVDGYVSTVCAMTWDGFKKTLPGISPIAVVADTCVYMEAPYRLTASGISDLFAKYIAIADWRISNVLTDEYICDYVCGLEENALDLMMEHIEKLSSIHRDEKVDAYEGLMYALILSGLAMQMVGNSRPASGAEHHISHLLEMEVMNDTLPFYHGEKVSVGLLIALEEYHNSVNLLMNNECINTSNVEIEEELIKKYFGKVGLSNQVLEENEPNPLKSIIIERLTAEKERIIGIINGLPSQNNMKGILSEANCITSLEELGLTLELKDEIIQLSPYVRNRLTWMRVIKLLRN